MRILLASCCLVALLCLTAITYPRLETEVDARLPLLSAYYLSRQLDADARYVRNQARDIPPPYASVIEEYQSTEQHPDFLKMRDMSADRKDRPLLDRLLLRIVLWRRGLPYDFMTADPVAELTRSLDDLRQQESEARTERSGLIDRHLIDCLKQQPDFPSAAAPVRPGLPPSLVRAGLTFCNEEIPLDRPDVRRRIEYQIEYLVGDFRETSELWLKRRDRYAWSIEDVLRKEDVPVEFRLLPALESGYMRGIVSPALATGWWQFVKPTAMRSMSTDKDLDWTLRIDSRLDQRKDLALSTRSAARYLKWMRARLGISGAPGSWLTTAAAYNAGFDEVQHRIVAYGTPSYWDMKLPAETENYVPRWIAFAIIDRHRAFYGAEGNSVAPLTFDTLENVRLSRDVPLALIATLTQASVRFIRELNGGLNPGESAFHATAAGSERLSSIHVPSGTRELVLEHLKARGYIEDEQ